MATNEDKAMAKRFDHPDERRNFKNHGFLDVVTFGDGITVARGIFEPGWRWSNDVKPIAETETCEASHTGFCLRGAMTIRMDNGDELHIKAGDAFHIPPGHDAWVDGQETCEILDVSGFSDYAIQPKPEKKAA